jgi:hypothetical protein
MWPDFTASRARDAEAIILIANIKIAAFSIERC